MKGKIRTALAAMLVIALMTGCVFGPPTATTPELAFNSTEVTMTEPLEFTINNYFSNFQYTISINGKKVEFSHDDEKFTVVPDGRWEKNVNTLRVDVIDDYGNQEYTEKDFLAAAKDTVKHSIKDGKLILRAVIETDSTISKNNLIWKVWFQDDKNPNLQETEPGKAATFTIPAEKRPEAKYEVWYNKGNNKLEKITEGIIPISAEIDIIGPDNHGGTPEDNGTYLVSVEGSVTINEDYVINSKTWTDDYTWTAKVNKQNITSVKVLQRTNNGRFTAELVIQPYAVKDGINTLQICISYTDIEGKIQSFESNEQTFFAYKNN